MVLLKKITSWGKILYNLFILRTSILFDKEYYLSTNPDVAEAGVDPYIHFLKYGGAEGRDPGPLFKTKEYKTINQDAMDQGCNPLIHYIRWGKQEGRKTHKDFNVINNITHNLNAAILENWLITKEQRYGGLIRGVVRRKVSKMDLRSSEELRIGGMAGGDRMSFHGYAKKYAEHLLPFLLNYYLYNKMITLVEIGTLRGTGLAIWADLFPKGNIIGLDIDPSHFNENYDNLKHLGAFKLSQPVLFEFDSFLENTQYLKSLLNNKKIDICIDDSVYDDKPIIQTFNSVLPYLAEDFAYFIEDNQTVYEKIQQKYPQFNVERMDSLTVITRRRNVSRLSSNAFLESELSDEDYTINRFQEIFHRPLDLENTKTFNEKLNAYKLFYRDKPLFKYADKHAVRDFVEKQIGKQYLIPLFGIYEDADEIVFDDLPNEFVLKATHGAGWNFLCKDKAKLNWEELKNNANAWLQMNYSHYFRERWYKDIPPRLMIEKLVLDPDGNFAKDYKFYCFSGEPKFFHIDSDRFENHTRNFYDINFNLLPVMKHYPNHSRIDEKPFELDRMLDITRKLSAGFPFVRIDLYSIPDVYFGEMTFCPGAGLSRFDPEEWDFIFGRYFELPENHNSS